MKQNTWKYRDTNLSQYKDSLSQNLNQERVNKTHHQRKFTQVIPYPNSLKKHVNR